MSEYKKRAAVPVLARERSLSQISKGDDDSPIFLSALKGSLLGLGASLGSGALLTAIMAAIAYANPDPSSLLTPLSLLAQMPSMFIGGFVASKKVGDAPLLCGVLCGGGITLVTILLSVILVGLPSSGYEFWQSAALHTASVGFSILGAFAGNVKRKPKVGKRRFGR